MLSSRAFLLSFGTLTGCHTNLRLKGKKGPPDEKPKRPTRLIPRRSSAYARGAAPKGLGLMARER